MENDLDYQNLMENNPAVSVLRVFEQVHKSSNLNMKNFGGEKYGNHAIT